MYKLITSKENNAIRKVKKIDLQTLNNKEDILKANSHTNVYKVIETINTLKEDL